MAHSHEHVPSAPSEIQSDVARRHPEEHRVGIGNHIDILQNSSKDRRDLRRMADEGWHSMAAMPKYESAEPANGRSSDVATAGSSSRDTTINQSSNQSQIVSPSPVALNASPVPAGETTAGPGSGPGPVSKNVQSEEGSVIKRTGHNRGWSRGGRRGGQGYHRDDNSRNTRDNGARLSQNHRHYHQPINFVRAKAQSANQRHKYYYDDYNHSQPEVIKTSTSTGTVLPSAPPPAPEGTVKPEPYSHPSEIQPTSNRPGEPTGTEESKQSRGDGGSRTISQTVDPTGLPIQETSITSVDPGRVVQPSEKEVDIIDIDSNNNVMGFESRYPSGPRAMGASTASPSARDGSQPITARTWGRGNNTGCPDAVNAPGKPGPQQTPETAPGAFADKGSRPAEETAKDKRANDANGENVRVADKQVVSSSPNEPGWDTISATPTKILVHRGSKPNQSSPKEVRNDLPKAGKPRRSSKWPSKGESKPSKVSPQERSEEVSGASDASWPSNETVKSFDGLRNWDGGWAPPPIEWETRPGWKDRNMTEHLYVWLERSQAGEAPDLKSEEFQSGSGTVDGNLLVASPEDELTLPNPEKSEKAGQTSNTAMLMKRIRWLEQRLQQKEKELRQALASKGPVIYAPDIPPNPHAPRANIYLRHAMLADLAACKDIYNHYSATSVVVPHIQPLSQEAVREHYVDVRNQRLPWIVAVERSPQSNGYKSAGKDKIVGYAYADDYGGPKDSYRYTVEMQVFTHHKHLRMGIGKTLMDRLILFLDPMYNTRGGYDFIDNDDFWGSGGQRVISKVLCNIAYTMEDNSEMKWLRKWLEGFEFDEMGTLKAVGLKFNKWLNVLHMQRNTGSSISLVNVN